MSGKKWLPMEDSRGHHWSDYIELEKIQDVKSEKEAKKSGQIVTKKAPKISLRERAAELVGTGLTFRAMEFEAVGVPRHYLSIMCDEGTLERVSHGRYRLARSPSLKPNI
jgi:hypothetical protein